MSQYHECPKCGKPAKAYMEVASYITEMVGKLRKFYCEHCKFSFWREPRGLG